MEEAYFEIRDRELPAAAPLAIASTYEEAMVALTAWTDRFWAQLDANGEGGVGLRLHLVVNQVGPQGSPVVRATSTVSG